MIQYSRIPFVNFLFVLINKLMLHHTHFCNEIFSYTIILTLNSVFILYIHLFCSTFVIVKFILYLKCSLEYFILLRLNILFVFLTLVNAFLWTLKPWIIFLVIFFHSFRRKLVDLFKLKCITEEFLFILIKFMVFVIYFEKIFSLNVKPVVKHSSIKHHIKL